MAVARMLGVSDNALRKWCRQEGIEFPRRRSKENASLAQRLEQPIDNRPTQVRVPEEAPV